MLKRFFNDLKKYKQYIFVSAKSDLRAEISTAYLNWLWWVLEPLAFMLIYVLIFGVVFGRTQKYYTIFIFIGITLWNFFSKTLTSSVHLIKNNKSIVSKVYLPKYVLLLQKMYVNAFKMSISFMIIIIMMFINHVPLSNTILYSIWILFTLLLFIFGFSLFFVHFGVFVEDLSNIVRIGLRLMFYLTGIFYSVEERFADYYGVILSKFNPIAFLISAMRNVMLYQKVPSIKWLTAWSLLSCLLIVVGIGLIYKNENSYVKVI